MADAELVQIRKHPRHRRSLGTARLTIAERVETAEIEAELRAEGSYEPMPKTRADCPPVGMACQFVKCKFHLALDVADSGAVKVAHWRPTDIVDLGEMRETCALRVADGAADREGGTNLETVGRLMGLSLERVRQSEKNALAKLRRTMGNAEDYPPALREMLARLVAAAEGLET